MTDTGVPVQRKSIDAIYRREAGRVLATLIRLLGDFDRAEEARQDAFAAALEQWPERGVPDNPCAWLVQTARNKAIDHLRRESLFLGKITDRELAGTEKDAGEIEERLDSAVFGDDQLRLIFTCCHPALAAESQIALTLRAVCGLTTAAVARAFLVSEEAMAQRLVRAQRKIRDAGIPYETPPPSMLERRIDGVLGVVYAVFTEGYAVSGGEELVNAQLCLEAIRLGRLLDDLVPENAAVMGLLALMLLHDARRAARTSASGDVVLLDEQNRTLWDHGQIAEGLALVERALRMPGRVSHYSVQAAIAALHVQAPDKDATDWRQIVGLYEVLLRLHSTPIIELNHAVAVSQVEGPARALELVDSLAARGEVRDYHLLHAARANLLSQLGRQEEAREAYRAALGVVKLAPERRFLQRRLAELESGGASNRLSPASNAR
jgi:RNA polymerase sigma-70 factor (ECF subfamily)